MYNIIPLIIVIISLTIVLVIIARKFSRLSNLDTENLPEEKVVKKKKEIINNRMEEKSKNFSKKVVKKLQPVVELWGQMQLRFRIYVGKVQNLWHHEQIVKKKKNVEVETNDKGNKTLSLIHEAEECLQNEEYEQAEDLFISAISLDSKSAPAYRGLGDAYLAKKELEEARQTYRFLLRLEPDDDSVLVKLAEISESQGDLEEAIEYYQQASLVNDALSPRFYHLAELLLKIEQPETAKEAIKQAVDLETQNPKYLDLFIETAIICQDKEMALEGFDKLRLVNPDNRKLDGFRDRINRITKTLKHFNT